MTVPARRVDALPKVELHVHLEGTLEPELILAVAERNHAPFPAPGVEALRARYRFADLQGFLDLYYANMDVLRTEEDFAEMTAAYLVRAAAGGVRRAEPFIDPQAHTSRGVALRTVMEGVLAGLAAGRDLGVSTGLIVTFLRDRPAGEALGMLREILAAGYPILGVGLDSAEVGHPPEPFADVFALARAEGLRCVAHAGEEGPPAYVAGALDALGAERIDHGIRSLEDDELVARLVEAATPLTVCPLSNLALGVVPTLAAHPLPQMLKRGLVVTVNSDDPAYFGGYIDDNYRAVADVFGFDDAALAGIARNGVAAAFVTPAERRALLGQIDRWQRNGSGPTA